MRPLSLEEERALLEQQADLSRARLLGLLEALDQKRERALSPTYQARRQLEQHPAALAVAGGSTAIAVGGVVAASVYLERRRRDRLFLERLWAVGRFWKHPERLVPRKPTSGLFAQIGRKLVVAFVTVVVVEPIRRLLKVLVGGGLERVLRRAQRAAAELDRPEALPGPALAAPRALAAHVPRLEAAAPSSVAVTSGLLGRRPSRA
jgi:hypothetical protein